MSVPFAVQRNGPPPHLVRIVFARRIVRPTVLLVIVRDKEQVLHHTTNVGVRLDQLVVLQSLVQCVPVHFHFRGTSGEIIEIHT